MATEPATKSSPGGFLRHAAVYGLGGILIQAAGFLLLPLYTRHLPPAEYGVLELLTRVGEVVLICFLLNGLRQATLAFYNQGEGAGRRQAVVGTAVLLACGSAAVSGSLLVVASRGLGGERLDASLLLLAGLSIFCEALPVIPLVLLQARVESGLYLLVNLGQFLLRTGLCVAFVVFLGLGARGVLLASVLTSGLFGVVLIARELRQAWGRPDRATVREMLAFALPFLPGGLGMFVLNSGDRFFLWTCAGEEALGLYALGYKMAWAVELLTRAPLHMVWSGRMYQAARREDAPIVFGEVFRRMVGFHLWGGLAVCLLQDDLVGFVAGGRYAGAGSIIPLVVLASVCSTAAALFDAGLYVTRRTALKVPVTLAATVAVLVLYTVLIPDHGAWGAAWATFLGFATLAAITFLASRRVFPVRYDLPRLAGMFLLALGLWLAGRLLPAEAWALPVKLTLAALYPPLLWVSGCVTATEKGLVGEIVQGWLATLRPRQLPDVPVLKGAEGP